MIFIPLILLAAVFTFLFWLGWRYFLGGVKSGAWQGFATVATLRAFTEEAEPPLSETAAGCAKEEPGSVRKMTSRWMAAFVLALSLGVVSMVVVGTLQFRERHVGEKFTGEKYQQQERIQQTFLEEKLVPPPALPPEAFTDAIAENPSLSLDRADRDWNKMNPAFVQGVLRVMARMKERGFPMVLLEGYRSAERQNMLAGKSVTVTHAKGGESKHQYGLAADLAPVRDGKVVISERNPWAMQAYLALGEEVEAAGLGWGGRFSFKDYGHIEKPGSIRSLIRNK